MLSQNIIYYGKDTPPPARVPLCAGPLNLIYEQGDLRSIYMGEHEILRRVYVAIRDRNWGTVLPFFSSVNLQVEPDHFMISYDVKNRTDNINFAWHGEISGDVDGTITFRMEGIAQSTFFKNRIGFCVLHPALLSGEKVEIEHSDGTREQAQFPFDICANQPVLPFTNLSAIRHQITTGVWAEVRFSGDFFEMEDQRLWTDASYKTYCTPLGLPFPVEIQSGTKVVQSVTIRLWDEQAVRKRKTPANERGMVGGTHAGNSTAGRRVSARMVREGDWKSLPALGLSAAYHGKTLSKPELERLRALRLHHLRLELSLASATYLERLRQVAGEASSLNIPIELALGIRIHSADEDLATFRHILDELRPDVCGWLVFPSQEPFAGDNPSDGIAKAAWQFLKSYNTSIPLAIGTNSDYIFVKRTSLPLSWMDQVCITLNPQVHAFDNQSLIESLEAQPMVVESARRLAKGLPVVVSPITLKPRFNPYATGPQPEPAPDELPPSVDPRQVSLFAAGWTLGSLRAMVSSGAERVTYYETTGWRGIMETEQGSPLPQAFPSLPGNVFPLYHVLADYGEFIGGQTAILTSSDPLRISGLAFRKPGKQRFVLANHTADLQHLSLEELTGDFYIRSLDETNVEISIQSPEIFRRSAGNKVKSAGNGLEVEINPFGILVVECYSLSSEGHDVHTGAV